MPDQFSAHPPTRDMLLASLQRIAFLRGLDPVTLSELADSVIWRVYTPGAMIFLEGEAAFALYYVYVGWLKVIKSSVEGREQILRFAGPGEILNELGVFSQRPTPATAIALEPVGLWLLPREALQRLLTTHPVVALGAIENLTERIFYLLSLITDFSLHTVETRLARLLLEQAENDVMPRPPWATQTELAARLGTVPDVLSRLLRKLVETNVIELNRAHIRILDRQALAALAQLEE